MKGTIFATVSIQNKQDFYMILYLMDFASK